MVEQKRCSRCGEIKDVTEFGPDKRTNVGIRYWCKKCEREWHRAKYETDPRYKEYAKRYNAEHKIRKPCVVCGGPKEPHRRLYCKTCAPASESCCDFLKNHHEQFKDDPERLPTGFLKKLMNCNCKAGK